VGMGGGEKRAWRWALLLGAGRCVEPVVGTRGAEESGDGGCVAGAWEA
jgi:hypothetical protein